MDSDYSLSPSVFGLSLWVSFSAVLAITSFDQLKFSPHVAAAYTANLASFLVNSSQPSFRDITIKDAELLGDKVCARGGAAVDLQLQAKYPKLNIVRGDTFEETYEKLQNGECFMLATRKSDWDNFQRNVETNPDCNLYWIGRPEQVNAGGLATKVDLNTDCTSLLQAVFDIHMNEMLNDGFVDKVWNDLLEETASNKCAEKESAESDGGDDEGSLTPLDVGKNMRWTIFFYFVPAQT